MASAGHGPAGNVPALQGCSVRLEQLNIAQAQVSSSPSTNFAKVKKNRTKRSRSRRSRPSGNFLNECCQFQLVELRILERMAS
jgi:hypothetical protein